MNYITADKIDGWAKTNPRRAQEIIPELVIRMILATSNKIEYFDFPIESGIQYSGYDGVLISGEQTNFFPEGKSVWEFGTNDDALQKFRSDIEKRTKNPLGENTSSTSFIFITPKIWNHRLSKEELINESKKNYNWKDIQIIDVSKIAIWLEYCPAVQIWLSEIMEEYIPNVISVDKYWEEYCNSTVPELNEEFFLTGRSSKIEEFNKYLDMNNRGSIVLSSESVLESTLFALSVARSLPKTERQRTISKMIVVTKIEAWGDAVLKYGRGIIFIPVFCFNENTDFPADISAILPVSRYDDLSHISSNIQKIELVDRTKAQFDEALKALGYDIVQTEKITSKTKRKFMSFYRYITIIPTRKSPKWTNNDNRDRLLPVMLVGAWDENYEGDKEVIEKLSGVKYDEYKRELNKFIQTEDAPLIAVLNKFQAVSITDLWDFLFELLTEDDVNRFKECVIEVLSTVDEKFDLPEEHWPMSSLIGVKNKFSKRLYRSIAVSLVILSEKDGEENHCNILSTENYVYEIINYVLNTVNTWQRWNTISINLPLLAEASPRAFIEKMEKEVDQDDSPIWFLFKPVKDIIMGSSYYTYILWALEALVWYKLYAVKAIAILAKIGDKKFEYNINTLYEIFCLWNPQNCFSNRENIKLIEKIYDMYPYVGWELINKLLSIRNSLSSPIYRPKWRSYEEQDKVTYIELQESVMALLKLSIEKASNSKDEWLTIFRHIDLYHELFKELYQKCIDCCGSMPEDDVLVICDVLRGKIHNFRCFRKSSWEVPADYVNDIEKLLLEITPDSIKRYIYLFKWNPNILNPVPYDETSDIRYDENRQLIYKTRKEAVYLIIKEYGLDSLIEFCRYVEDTRDLANILSEEVLKSKYDFNIILRIKMINYSLYVSILWSLLSIHGIDTLIEILNSNNILSNEEKGDILCHTPSNFGTWQKINLFNKEIICYYWHHTREFPRDEDYEILTYYINKMLEYRRPFSAIKNLYLMKYNDSEIIIQVLEKCIELQEEKETDGTNILSLSKEDFMSLFKRIYKNKNVDETIVARLELVFLAYFSYDDPPECLPRYFEKNPEDYVLSIFELVKLKDSLDEKDTLIRKKLYEMLICIKRVPGCNADIVSEHVFNNWIYTAKNTANKIGCIEQFESFFGKLLSYAPSGDDGIFPHEIIRGFFEKNTSDNVVRGFLSGIYNQRGVHAVTGGEAELEIAQKYYDDADKIRIEFPNTADILYQIGKQYSEESRYERKREQIEF